VAGGILLAIVLALVSVFGYFYFFTNNNGGEEVQMATSSESDDVKMEPQPAPLTPVAPKYEYSGVGVGTKKVPTHRDFVVRFNDALKTQTMINDGIQAYADRLQKDVNGVKESVTVLESRMSTNVDFSGELERIDATVQDLKEDLETVRKAIPASPKSDKIGPVSQAPATVYDPQQQLVADRKAQAEEACAGGGIVISEETVPDIVTMTDPEFAEFLDEMCPKQVSKTIPELPAPTAQANDKQLAGETPPAGAAEQQDANGFSVADVAMICDGYLDKVTSKYGPLGSITSTEREEASSMCTDLRIRAHEEAEGLGALASYDDKIPPIPVGGKGAPLTEEQQRQLAVIAYNFVR
jgi:hypothetical protein